MGNRKIKIGKYWLLLPVFLAFIFTCALSLSYSHSVGVDIHFHLDIAEQYAKGNFMGAAEVSLKVDNLIYPPLFHFLLVPAVWFNISYPFTLILQTIFLPIAVLSFEYLIAKTLGYNVAFMGGFLVLSSWAYSDRVTQVIPHSVDLILLPLAMLFSLQNSDRKFLFTSVLMIWNHGLVALTALGGSLLNKLWLKKWRVMILFLIGGSVIFALSLWYLPSALLGYGSGFCTNQEKAFWTSPVSFWVTYVGLLTFGFVVVAYRLILLSRGTKLSKLSLISIVTIFTTAIMIPVWADRWVQFSAVPLAFLILEHFNETKGHLRFIYAFCIFLFFIGTYSLYWLLLIARGFQS